jgi:hypothetical protein
MALLDDEDQIGLLDPEDELRERKGVASIATDDTAVPAKPPESITGPAVSTAQPTSITAGPLESATPKAVPRPPLEPGESSSVQGGPLGPAAQREQGLLDQGPPQYHGLKKVLDIAGRVTGLGRNIEEGTGLGTLGYESKLGQASRDTARESALAKAPLDVSYEQAKTQEQQSKAEQEKAKANALLHPPAKPGAGSKIAFHYPTEDGKMLAVFEDGDTQELPPGQQKEVAEKYPGLTADELAQFPPPKKDQFTNPAEYEKAQAAWGKQVSDFKQKQKIDLASAGSNARGAAFGRNRAVEVLDTYNGNRPIRVSAGEAEDNPDRYVTQSGGASALGKQVTKDDITGALNNLKAATKVLDKGTFNRAAVAAVLADPHATATQFAQSEVAKHLDADEQDYVIAALTAREVLPGLRGLMPTGQATDARVALMLSTLPGARTPSSEFANKQIDAIMGTLERVGPGIPNVKPKNNPNAPPTTPPTTPPAATAAPKTAAEWLASKKKKPE